MVAGTFEIGSRHRLRLVAGTSEGGIREVLCL